MDLEGLQNYIFSKRDSQEREPTHESGYLHARGQVLYALAKLTKPLSVALVWTHRNKINPEVDLFKKCGHVSMLREVIVDGQIDLRLALEDL